MTVLDDYHQRLAEHFTTLVRTRTEVVNRFGSVVQQVFALEHGLSDPEYEEMNRALKETLSSGRPLGPSVLPLVVVATEVAFKAQWPYWKPLFTAIGVDDTGPNNPFRKRVRTYFQDFADRYNGPRPSGAFAEQFNLIAWPLENALIPTDLQEHLYTALELVIASHDPEERPLTHHASEELGDLIAAQVSTEHPARFQGLCKNAELVGTVVLAWLDVHVDDASSFPEAGARKKITEGLSDLSLRSLKKRQREEGKRRTKWEKQRRRGRREGHGGLVQQQTEPRLQVVFKNQAWFAEVQLPDPDSLIPLHPRLGAELHDRRLWITGYNRPVEAGQIFFPHRPWYRLETWPPDGEPFIKLDGVDSEERIAHLLKVHCSLKSEPWLFELQDPTTGPERIGKIVRPGGQYLLLRREPIANVPAWAATVECGTSDVHAYLMDLPEEFDSGCRDSLKSLKLEPRVGIGVAPVGLPPAYWEGDGVAEWTLGERPVLRLSCSGSPASYEVRVDGGLATIRQPWPDGEQAVYVQFKDLAVGQHDVEVSFLDNQHEPQVRDEFEINIRPEYAGSNTRQALKIHPSSEQPSLNDLWLGSTELEFTGPDGAEVHVTIRFTTNDGSAIPEASFKCRLPLSAPDWHSRFREQVRTREDLIVAYDEESMEGCSVQIDHSEFGNYRVEFDRFYPPLVWEFRSDEGGHGVKLRVADRGERDDVDVKQYTSLLADWPKEHFEFVQDSVNRAPMGALFSAETESNETTAVVPPREDGEIDGRFFKSIYPKLDTVYYLTGIYQKWAAAESFPEAPAEVFRRRVCRTLLSHMAAVVCGDPWAEVEREALRDACSIEGLCKLLTDYPGPDVKRLAVLVKRRAELLTMPIVQRSGLLEEALSDCAPAAARESSVDSLVKLAADPSLFELDSNELKNVSVDVQKWPTLLRATRALVLLVHFQGSRTAENGPYRGWEWN